MKVIFINPNADFYISTNIGLAYVMTYVEKEHTVSLLDMSFYTRQKDILDNIKEFKPDVIAFSVTTLSIRNALNTAAIIKNFYPEIPLIYGCIHPTLLPEETLQNPLVDAICIGEGEEAFKEYLDKLQNNQEPKGVKGIWYKDKSGNPIRNPLRPFREDLDSIPFPNWDHWEMERYLDIEGLGGEMTYLFSRGCPYSCSFCLNSAIAKAVPGKFYRLRSAENVIEEIKFNKEKFGDRFQHVSFGDENFGANINDFKKLAGLYIKEKLNYKLPWRCITHPSVITEEWCKVAKDAGCVILGLGVESGDENLRKNVFKKNITSGEIRSKIKILQKFNILYYIYIVLGIPGESRDTVKRTVNLINEIKPTKTLIHIYDPIPHTELAKSIRNFGEYKSEWLKNSSLFDIFKMVFPWWVKPPQGEHSMSIKELKKAVLQIKVKELISFLSYNFKLGKFSLIFDIAANLFNLNRSRKFPLTNPYFASALAIKTLIRPLILTKKGIKQI